MDIKITERGSQGFAIGNVNGNKAGVMTYSIPDEGDFIIIDHTDVEAAFKGQDIGKQLLMKVVEMARDKNLKIIPLCPFANSMFKKMSEIRDVLK